MSVTEYVELARQPIGYWSAMTHRAVSEHFRRTLAKEQLQLPHWWILNLVDDAPATWTRADLAHRLADCAGPGVAFDPCSRNWTHADG